MTDEKPVPTPRKSDDAPKPEPQPQPEVVATGGSRAVTSPVDLRVVTKDLAVFLLAAGVSRELNEKMFFEAQKAAAEAKITLDVK